MLQTFIYYKSKIGNIFVFESYGLMVCYSCIQFSKATVRMARTLAILQHPSQQEVRGRKKINKRYNSYDVSDRSK